MSQPLRNTELKNLKQILGTENASTDLAKRRLFSQDIWTRGKTADFVISPETTEQLSEAVKIAARHNVKLNPRGGGMSYTEGYIPSEGMTGVLDFSRMNKVLEVNAEDMYVTVQAGCTWKTLYEALVPLGLRTPFWGPLSGWNSTVGGGLSQNNAFFGAGVHRSSIDSVVTLSVVLADGTILKTGSAGTKNGKPFWRHYGPDLTWLFLADSGALGYKAEATLRLIPCPPCDNSASFEFNNASDWVNALSEMGRLGLACEICGFDPNLQKVRMMRAGLAADLRSLTKVITSQKGGLLKGLKEGAKVALAGRSYMDDVAYSIHFIVEGHSDPEVIAKIETLKQINTKHGGNEIENSIPKIMRANPFVPPNVILGPRGERWAPKHGIVPMGDAKACQAEIDAFFENHRLKIEQYEITTGFLLTTLSTNGFIIEPVFLWPEEIFAIHEQSVEASVLRRIERFENNPQATAFVAELKSGIIDIFSKYGAAHMQIGRTYPYRDNRKAPAWELLQGIKALVDPGILVNSGALGLCE